MGYRSDVVIAVAFAEKQHLDEVMAVYALNMYVQKHDLLSSWEIGEYDDAWVAMYNMESVKWYDTYEDVTGLNALGELAKKFWEERSIPYAYRFVRVGEEDADVEIDVHDCHRNRCNHSHAHQSLHRHPPRLHARTCTHRVCFVLPRTSWRVRPVHLTL